jgi:hypothetical protein
MVELPARGILLQVICIMNIFKLLREHFLKYLILFRAPDRVMNVIHISAYSLLE